MNDGDPDGQGINQGQVPPQPPLQPPLQPPPGDDQQGLIQAIDIVNQERRIREEEEEKQFYAQWAQKRLRKLQAEQRQFKEDFPQWYAERDWRGQAEKEYQKKKVDEIGHCDRFKQQILTCFSLLKKYSISITLSVIAAIIFYFIWR